MLIGTEKRNALDTVMKHRVFEKKLTCLDQKKYMMNLWISVSEYGCEVKCPLGVPDLLFSAQCNALRNIAH
jgi:predicted transposase YdaD